MVVAFLVVVAALVTKLVAALVGHWVAGLLAGGKCRLAASDPRRRAQPPSREPVSRSQRQRQHQWHPNAQPQCRGPVSHNDNDNTRTVLVPGVIRLRSSFRGSSFQEKTPRLDCSTDIYLFLQVLLPGRFFEELLYCINFCCCKMLSRLTFIYKLT